MSNKGTDKKRISSEQLAKDFVRFHGHEPSTASRMVPSDAQVGPFDAPNLNSPDSTRSYAKIQSSFKQDLSLGDRRFMLSDLVADHLSVEAEEQARFEKRVKVEVEKQLQEFREEAYQKGHAEGHEVGRSKAYEEEKLRLAVAVEKLTVVTESMKEAKENLSKQYEVQLIEMAFKVAGIILHREIQERPENITSVITHILERISREDDVRIRLSESSFEVIQLIQEKLKELSRTGHMGFDVDHALKAGDVVVESLGGEIASFITERLKFLEQEVLKQASRTDRAKLTSGKTGTES